MKGVGLKRLMRQGAGLNRLMRLDERDCVDGSLNGALSLYILELNIVYV